MGAVGQAIDQRLAYLTAQGIPFIDVGMGVLLNPNGGLCGIVRTTMSTPATRAAAAPHISYAEGDPVANAYTSNIQIAELNMLNASLAVIQWKRLHGIYVDLRNAVYTGYSIPSGEIANKGHDDAANAA